MIHATAVLPKAFKPDAFEREFTKKMEMIVTDFGRDFSRTVQTWDDKPAWTHDVVVSANAVTGRWVTIADVQRPADANIVYRFITRGTSIRYATMTRDFVPKTQPGVLDSSAGHPGLAYVSKKRPRPGIKPRGWEELIKRRKEKRVLALMQKAMRDGAKASGHGI